MSGTLQRYIRGHSLVTMRDVPGGKKYVYHADQQGTTQCLTDAATGSVTDTFASDAWGNQVKRTGTSINRQWYIGGADYYSDTAHRIYVRARHLNNVTGRFRSEDPRPAVKRYPYADNNPASYIDPSGKIVLSPTPCATWDVGGTSGATCHCGAGLASWSLRFDKVMPKTLSGWFVQEVVWTGAVNACCPGCDEFLYDHYWEGFRVTGNGLNSITGNFDFFQLLQYDPGTGYQHKEGTMKFFSDADLATFGGTAVPTNWGNFPEAGAQPATREKPSWWDKPPSMGESQANHSIDAYWGCCPCSNRWSVVFASTGCV